ncbi:MAG: Flp pilus assembly complex ATPase component TadA [Burkholderiales bacterium]|nr:Flp pilus assembly complex ATPase component TadA [Burkholderiales bacterium]
MTAPVDTQPIGLDEPHPVHKSVPGTLDDLRQALDAPAGHRARHLGEALVERGLIDGATLRRMLELQRNTTPHRLLGQLLLDNGALTPLQLNSALAAWMGVPLVDPRRLAPDPDALRRIPRALAERESVVPLMLHGDALVVALADPWDQALLEQLRFAADQRVLPVMALPGTLGPAVAQAYRGFGSGAPGTAGAAQPAEVAALAQSLAGDGEADVEVDPAVLNESDNTLVRLVNAVIADAVRLRASDIHIETSESRPVRVRLRIDGELVPYLELPLRLRFALVARLKIMADLDISEHRKPQDGKIAFARFGGAKVELRMVTVPTLHGLEDVVLRILSGLKPMPIESIGLSATNLAGLRGVITKPYGLILICGPTGCGKTTTLHSVLRELNTNQRKIWTAEDPVEITQEGLRQVQVNARIGWTFAAAMRTFLRADPDVIMIGEMRDAETARIAIEASLTGHLVLSTLHTNSAPESITRLLEIGLDPFMFSDSLLGILAQRLVRRLCTKCRKPEPMSPEQLRTLAQQHVESAPGCGTTLDALVERWQRQHGDAQGRIVGWRRVGCDHCEHSGYQGRLGLHELMLATEGTRELVRHRAPAAELQAAGLAGGMVTLRQDGIEKVLAGLTDMAEVLAATNQ